jgi:hypothetical protein
MVVDRDRVKAVLIGPFGSRSRLREITGGEEQSELDWWHLPVSAFLPRLMLQPTEAVKRRCAKLVCQNDFVERERRQKRMSIREFFASSEKLLR